MPYNGSGVFQRLYRWTTDKANGIDIDSTRSDAEIDGIATGLSNCITKDGQQTVTANIPFGGFAIQQLGSGASRTDAPNIGQIQDGQLNWVQAGGTADAITATFSPPVTVLVDGIRLRFRATGANATTTPTFAPNGLPAVVIKKNGGSALAANDIAAANAEVDLTYNAGSTFWNLNNPAVSGGGGTGTVTSVQVADGANGGLSFAGGPIVNAGTITASLKPSDLLTKASPSTSDSAIIMDASASNVAKTATLSAILALSTAIPSGAIIDFAGSSAPSGWLLCAGQAVSRTGSNAALFAAIGTTYGSGDGSTTFNLPDLRGRIAAGVDNMNGSAANRITSGGSGITGTTLGAVGGSETQSLTTAQLASHAHSGGIDGGGHTSGSGLVEGTGSGCTSVTFKTNTGSAGSGNAHNNTQPTMMLNKIIKQ